MSIEVQKLANFGKQAALKDVSNFYKKGEIVGFLGSKWSRKVHLMKIICCYLDADKGSAIVCGNTCGSKQTKVKGLIGYLPNI